MNPGVRRFLLCQILFRRNQNALPLILHDITAISNVNAGKEQENDGSGVIFRENIYRLTRKRGRDLTRSY